MSSLFEFMTIAALICWPKYFNSIRFAVLSAVRFLHGEVMLQAAACSFCQRSPGLLFRMAP